MPVPQMMFIDFYEFHARQNPQSAVSALTASVMRRFINLLERGDYRKNLEVGYYADLLCVTPKYLSEVCKGDVLQIPAGVRHWHGATKDNWFSQVQNFKIWPINRPVYSWEKPVYHDTYQI